MKNLLLSIGVALLVFSGFIAGAQTSESSFPQANGTIFLDFDGHTVSSGVWQNGNTFVCAPAGMTVAQVNEIFKRTSEDFRPFHVNVTTDSTAYWLAPADKRIRVIVTPTSSWAQQGLGGVSFLGTFTWGDNTPSFVFSDRLFYNTKNVAECCTHEAGHALGLAHQSRYNTGCAFVEEYHTGYGEGQTGWAPVMGYGYGKNMTGWNEGPTPYGCSVSQDNLTVITTQNGFSFRADDFPATMTTATLPLNENAFSQSGIISEPTDKDAFRLVITQPGPIYIHAKPFSVANGNEGADLDIQVELYNAAGGLVRRYNPVEHMHVFIDTTLNAGVYYLQISGAGNNNTSSYGSLGSYTLTGARNALPIHNLTLRASVEKQAHRLNWNVVADEQIASYLIESSVNGTTFTPVRQINGNETTSLESGQSGTVWYRVTATSVINEKMRSNLVKVKAADANSFSVQTITTGTINVVAPENFQYRIFDGTGRYISAGTALKGQSQLNVSNLADGMYVLQLQSEGYTQTERFIRQ